MKISVPLPPPPTGCFSLFNYSLNVSHSRTSMHLFFLPWPWYHSQIQWIISQQELYIIFKGELECPKETVLIRHWNVALIIPGSCRFKFKIVIFPFYSGSCNRKKKIIISRRISFPYAELLLRLYFNFFIMVTPKRALFYCLRKEMQIKFLQHDISL